MSKKEIKEEMDAITETGLIPCFAIKKGSSFDWEYSPEEELQKRYLRGNRRTQ